MFPCCDRGGCCNPYPPAIEVVNGSNIRVNVIYYAGGCCGPVEPFDIKDVETVPVALLEKGLVAVCIRFDT